jgi:4-aminobutyrate aminotransferase-like enzyme
MNASLLERRYRVMGQSAPLFYDDPLHIVRGDGVWLYDEQGRSYLDAYNNVAVVGHCHPRVVEAIARQSSALNIHTRYLHEKVVEYAERLTATFEGQDMAVFTCTGSEANDVALQMARVLSGKQGIICSDNAYHGNTASVQELSTAFSGGKAGSNAVRAVPIPNAYRAPRGSQDGTLDARLDAIRSSIQYFQDSRIGLAGMLVCPIFANEGLPDVPAGFLSGAADLVRRAGGLVIFDEVQAGFGRTGEFWGHSLTGVIPDIVTLGKPMGNGHPVAGVISRASIINAFRDRVMYFNTFGGNPVSCAAAMAVLDVIEEEGLVGHVRQLGPSVAWRLRELMNTHEAVGDVRAKGTFWIVELVTNRSSKTPATDRARAVVNRMRDHGVLISRAGEKDNLLKIRPPLVFSASHADLLIDVLDRSLAETADA